MIQLYFVYTYIYPISARKRCFNIPSNFIASMLACCKTTHLGTNECNEYAANWTTIKSLGNCQDFLEIFSSMDSILIFMFKYIRACMLVIRFGAIYINRLKPVYQNVNCIFFTSILQSVQHFRRIRMPCRIAIFEVLLIVTYLGACRENCVGFIYLFIYLCA